MFARLCRLARQRIREIRAWGGPSSSRKTARPREYAGSGIPQAQRRRDAAEGFLLKHGKRERFPSHSCAPEARRGCPGGHGLAPLGRMDRKRPYGIIFCENNTYAGKLQEGKNKKIASAKPGVRPGAVSISIQSGHDPYLPAFDELDRFVFAFGPPFEEAR